jgi:hypothetical protein
MTNKMHKKMKTLSFKQYKALAALIDADGGIVSATSKIKLQDFETLVKRGLAKMEVHFGRKVFFTSDGFGTNALIFFQKITFESECCGQPGGHKLVAGEHAHCLDCGNTHAKLKMAEMED